MNDSRRTLCGVLLTVLMVSVGRADEPAHCDAAISGIPEIPPAAAAATCAPVMNTPMPANPGAPLTLQPLDAVLPPVAPDIEQALAAAARGDITEVRRYLAASPGADREPPTVANAGQCSALVASALAMEFREDADRLPNGRLAVEEAVRRYVRFLTEPACREDGGPASALVGPVYLRLGRAFETADALQYFPAARYFYREASELDVREAEAYLMGLDERERREEQEAYQRNPDIAFALSNLMSPLLDRVSPDFRVYADRLREEALAHDSLPALREAAQAALHPADAARAPDMEAAVDYDGRAARKGDKEAIAWFTGWYDRYLAESRARPKEAAKVSGTDASLPFQRAGWTGNPFAQAVAERFFKDHRAKPLIRPQATVQWVSLPAGEYRISPALLIRLPAFQLSQTLVTFRQYQACVDAKACEPAHRDDGKCLVHTGLETSLAGVLPSRFRGEDQPAVCVDWEQARAFASWAGGRLPTEAEYEYAATDAGKSGMPGPAHPIIACSDAQLTFDDNNPGCGHSATAPVCSAYDGYSAQNACDLYGNVWEWMEDNWVEGKDSLPADGSPRRVADSIMRVQRGYGWANKPMGHMLSLRSGGGYLRTADDLGFRLARSVHP